MDKKVINSRLSLVNSRLTEVRGILTESIADMLGDKSHTYTGKSFTPYVTDEELCERLKAISITKGEVTLSDYSTLDLGEVGTDDLNSLAEALSCDLFEA